MPCLTKEARRELSEAVIALSLGPLENLANVRMQPPFSPVVTRGLFRTRRLAVTRGLEKRRCRRGVVVGVVARWKRVTPLRSASTGVLVYECTAHGCSISAFSWL